MAAMTRRAFLGALSGVAAALGRAATSPRNRNIQWALSLALWRNYPHLPLAEVFDVMRDTGFPGIRFTHFPGFLREYGVTEIQLLREMSRRGLRATSISWNGALADPVRREADLESARTAMKFLADFGASHLTVFSPSRRSPGAGSAAAFRELCARCNQIGEIAVGMGFTAGLHNHLGQMVQNQDEIDRFMAGTDPALFGLSPDTAHLHLAGCDVVGTLNRYGRRIHALDYKDARWTRPLADLRLPNGRVLAKDSAEARFYGSIYDLGDGDVDFPACQRVLRETGYRGWICVDLDIARHGPYESYRRCADYILRRLDPIYA
jgi:sugar phosphate isomerase/epimerase